MILIKAEGHLIYLRNQLDEFKEKYPNFAQSVQFLLEFYEDIKMKNYANFSRFFIIN